MFLKISYPYKVHNCRLIQKEINGEAIQIYNLEPDTNYIYNLHAYDILQGSYTYRSGDYHVKTLRRFVQDVSFASEPGLLVSPRLR